MGLTPSPYGLLRDRLTAYRVWQRHLHFIVWAVACQRVFFFAEFACLCNLASSAGVSTPATKASFPRAGKLAFVCLLGFPQTRNFGPIWPEV